MKKQRDRVEIATKTGACAPFVILSSPTVADTAARKALSQAMILCNLLQKNLNLKIGKVNYD